VYCCGRLPTFQMSKLLPFSGSSGGSMGLWNVGILPRHYTASQPGRPRLETSPPWRLQNSLNYKLLNIAPDNRNHRYV
jgi:hypothetical protein